MGDYGWSHFAVSATRTESRFVEATLIGYGIYSVLIGLFILIAPGTFFDTLGNIGLRNDHYLFDVASFELPAGLLLLGAYRWPSWRVPALAFSTIHWGIHAVSHLIDTHHAAGEWVGWLEFAGLAVSTVILALALRAARRQS